MNWKELPAEKKWVLDDNGDIAAMIILIEKDGIINRYQVKTLISAIYLGKRRFSRLDKRNNDWLATRRKFKTSQARASYITQKKSELFKYITKRVS